MDNTENARTDDAPQQTTGEAATPPAESPVADPGQSAPNDDRTALEEAHSRLEAAQKRIDAMLSREIEHQVKQRLEVPSDLFDLGKHEVADLLDDSGDVDSEKIKTAIDALLKARPNLAAQGMRWPDVGVGRGTYDDDDDDDTPDWNTALRGRTR
ncbi:hypothetical protein [Streptomyces luteireticuli]|uniref:hypothetical protein n=1 Tax=Streptomyces luteireticuli TaxID=173858 RepID=UPI0035592AB4